MQYIYSYVTMSHRYIDIFMVQRLDTSLQNIKVDVALLNSLIALSNLYLKIRLKLISSIFHFYRTNHVVVD